MKTTDKPVLQEFHLKGVKHILPEDALEAQKNKEAILIDLRDKYEIYAAHIENTLSYPIWNIEEWLPSVSKDQKIIFLCNKGIRSVHVAHFLMDKGYFNVANLDGGIEAWKGRKLPYIAFRQPRKP